MAEEGKARAELWRVGTQTCQSPKPGGAAAVASLGHLCIRKPGAVVI